MLHTIEIFQSILQCKMILALITTIPQLLKRFKQKLKMSQILWASAIIWLIWQHKPRGRNMLDLRNWYIWYYTTSGIIYLILFGNMLLFDFIQGAGSSLLNLLWLLIRVYSETNFCFIPSLVYIRLDRLKTHSDVVFGFDFQCKKFEYLDSS